MYRVLLLMTFIFSILLSGCTPKNQVTLAGAASLQAPLTELLRQEETTALHFAGSGTIRQQIENGAPVDLFLSASLHEATELVQAGIVSADALTPLLHNRLVLITNPFAEPLDSVMDLQNASGSIAIGNPETAPVGVYASQVLAQLDIHEDRFILANHVKQVVQYVASGDVAYGIVYQTDVGTDSEVSIVGELPSEWHGEITYVLINVSRREENEGYVKLLLSDDATGIFEEYGFEVIQ